MAYTIQFVICPKTGHIVERETKQSDSFQQYEGFLYKILNQLFDTFFDQMPYDNSTLLANNYFWEVGFWQIT